MKPALNADRIFGKWAYAIARTPEEVTRIAAKAQREAG